MKITYINETIKLPSNKQKKVTVDDITTYNMKYIKQRITACFNECFSSDMPIMDARMRNNQTLIPWIEQYDKNDVSPAILEINESTDLGEYEVILRLYMFNFNMNFADNEIKCIDINYAHTQFYNMLQQVVDKCDVRIKFKLVYYSISYNEMKDIVVCRVNGKIAHCLQEHSSAIPQINQLRLYRYLMYETQYNEYLKIWSNYVKMIINPLSNNLQVTIPIYNNDSNVPEYLLTAYDACVDANIKCNHMHAFLEEEYYNSHTDIYTWMLYAQQLTKIATNSAEFYILLPISVLRKYMSNTLHKRNKANSASKLIYIYMGILSALDSLASPTGIKLCANIIFYPEKSKFCAVINTSDTNITQLALTAQDLTTQIDLTAIAENISQNYNNDSNDWDVDNLNKYIYNHIVKIVMKIIV